MLTGVRPSGNITLGNYLGAIKNFVDRQDTYKSYIFIADLHAITSPQNPQKLKEAVYNCVAMYLACGIDPSKTIVFKQSDVLEHGTLGFIMTFQTKMGELNRMTQFKHKSQSQSKEGVDTGLFIYPTLMVADILLYNTSIVPVGKDQQQHVELTRDLAERFNKRYGETFLMPDVYIAPVGNKILNLQNPLEKMNKSDNGDNKGYTIFYDGNYGAFDNKCRNTVLKLKNKYPHIKLVLILTYYHHNREKYPIPSYYDDTILPELEDLHYKQKIKYLFFWLWTWI